MVLIFIMIDSILLQNIVKKRHPNCNVDNLVIDGSNVGFGGNNNLLAILKSHVLSEEISFMTRV